VIWRTGQGFESCSHAAVGMGQQGTHWNPAHTLLGYVHVRESSSGKPVSPTEVVELDEWRVAKVFNLAAGLGGPVVLDFTRDVMTVAKLRHPHVVQVEEAAALPNGTPYVVFERLRGKTLEAALADGAPVSPAELLSILRGVASALSAAHAAGVAHGELRAENVFLAEVPGYPRGFPKLLDFGVAQLSKRSPGDARLDRLALATLARRVLTDGRVVDSGRALALDRVLVRAARSSADGGFDSVGSVIEAIEAALTAPEPPPAVAAPPAAAPPPPSSLTQQFFTDGEKQEAAYADAAGDVMLGDAREPGASAFAAPAITRKLDRIPRSRAHGFAAAAVVLLAAAVMTGSLVSLSSAPGPDEASSLDRQPAANVSGLSSNPIGAAPATDVAPNARPILRRARLGSTTADRPRSPTQPPPVAAVTPAIPPGAVPAPAATPPAPPAPEPAPTAAATPPAAAPAATATPAAPFDEDFTQPWEQTEGEPSHEPASPEPGGPENTAAP
jgi:eukaryotic-like serine/threonine-protein kinase